jgi:hypothetical protein
MKTKVLSLIAIAAIVTVSFTFASVNTNTIKKNSKTNSAKVTHDESPIGGFAIEDKP